MRAAEPVVLELGRVRLEPLGPQHDEELLAAAQADEIWQWMPVARPRRIDEVRRIRTTHPGQPWAVVVDGTAAGSTSYLDVDPIVGGLEVGWTWYRRDLWASTVNPACKLLLLGHAFEVLGAQRVTLKTDALNARSRAAIAKLGCAYDGTLRHQRLRPNGSARDTAYFSMLTPEWPTARARLQARVVGARSG